MTTTTAHQRLDEIETHLTPTEWAVRLADEMRKFPDSLAHMKALAKLPLHELPVRRPYYAFEKQAAELHPGNKPENIRARHRLTDTLWNEFHKLKLLIRLVNQALQGNVEIISLQAALQLSALHALILEGIVAQPDNSETQMAEWSHEYTALLQEFYAHRAAVELVQDEHFAGHPILFLELEAEMTETARIIEIAVVTANDYLKHRAARDGALTDGGAAENNLAIGLESIRAGANGQRAAAIAEKWHRDASREAVETDEERWERCREEFGAREPATGNG